MQKQNKKAAAIIIYHNNSILSGINGAYSHETLSEEKGNELIELLLSFIGNTEFLDQNGKIDFKLIPQVYQQLNSEQKQIVYTFFKENTEFNIKQSHNGMFISRVNNKLDVIKGKEEEEDEGNIYKTIAREMSEEVKFSKNNNILDENTVREILFTYFSANNYPLHNIGNIRNKNYYVLLIRKEEIEQILEATIILSENNPENPNNTELFDLQFRDINGKYPGYVWNNVVKNILKRLPQDEYFYKYIKYKTKYKNLIQNK
jgi:hypothetical protein